MINKESIESMKDGVRILNFARGELVNNKDIKEAIESGRVGCYVVDFPNEETINLPGIISIPHLGASTIESEDNCAVMAAQEIADFLENGNITNSVNFPDCSLPLGEKGRIAIAHKNVPSKITTFTNIFAGSGINISDMINKSKKENAYTLMNVDSEITDEIVNKISVIDDVLSVRVIK
ncbi:MAG: 3-phosphoglycerate dehydrogenase, partial [Oscillospiraceae bacterium]|nr:3-phosphoglycerate dehydrogenase [Oscillospiraceae bacterium]